MKEYKFSGEYQILIFDILSLLIEETDTNEMSEGQLMVCMPHLLTRTATRQYRSACNSSYASGLRYWMEAGQNLPRTFATETAIRKAVEQFENIRQSRQKMKQLVRK